MALDLDLFEPEFVPEEVDHGDNGIVYRLGREYAAKILYYRDSNERSFVRTNDTAALYLSGEFETGRFLFENDVSIPRPIGVFMVPLAHTCAPGFVMEYIDGINAKDLEDPEYSIGMEKAEEEWRKTEMLGFWPRVDCHPRNVLWVPHEKTVRLVDYAGWTRLSEWGDENEN
jgi:hypothetical protein